jgi:hypothetical protein
MITRMTVVQRASRRSLLLGLAVGTFFGAFQQAVVGLLAGQRWDRAVMGLPVKGWAALVGGSGRR